MNWLEYIWQSIWVRFDHRLRALIFTDIALTPPRLIHGNLYSAVLYRCNTANKNGHKLNKIGWTRLVQWPRAMGEAGSKLNIVKSLPYAPFLDIEHCPIRESYFVLSASSEVSAWERRLNDKSKDCCNFQILLKQSYKSEWMSIEKGFLQLPLASQLVRPFYPPRLIDILLNRTFTTYSVHLLPPEHLPYRFYQESSPSKAISPNWDLNNFVQENRKMQLKKWKR